MKLQTLLCIICFTIVLGPSLATAQDTVSYTVSWNPISDPTVTNIVVYRSTTSGSGFVQVAMVSTSETEYTDAGLEHGVRYYYCLKARSYMGSLSPFSAEVSGLTLNESSPDWMDDLCQVVAERQVTEGVHEIDWTTDNPSTGLIRYKPAGDPVYQESVVDGVPALSHTTAISGIEIDEDYFVRAVAYDQSGRNMTVSKDYAFDTYTGSVAFDIVTDVDTVIVPEGETAQFGIRLDADPGETVEISVARTGGDVDIDVVDGDSLTFTPSDWNVLQQVTLAAAEDADWESNQALVIAYVTSGQIVPVKNVVAYEDDDETSAVLAFVVQPTRITVPEGGEAAFEVELSTEPAETVGVFVERISGDGDISVTSGNTLVFTTNDWQSPQTVVLSCAEDADAVNGEATIRVRSYTDPTIPELLITAVERDHSAVAATAGPLVAYPVPFLPEEGVLTIDNGVVDGKIEIFDLRGRCVWNASFGDGTNLQWNGDNLNASAVASGRYLVVVRDAENRVVEKKAILVVR